MGDSVMLHHAYVTSCELAALEGQNSTAWMDWYTPPWQMALDYWGRVTYSYRADFLQGRASHCTSGAQSAAGVEHLRLCYVVAGAGHSRRPQSLHGALQRMQQLSLLGSNDVIIVNEGVWHMQAAQDGAAAPAGDELHLRAVQSFVTLARALPVRLVLWRETLAQHFNHTHGLYYRGHVPGSRAPRWNSNGSMVAAGALPSENFCFPSSMKKPEVLRNVKQALLSSLAAQRSRFRFVDAWRLTAPMHEGHPAESGGADCTHFCFFRGVYGGVSDLIAHAIRSALGPRSTDRVGRVSLKEGGLVRSYTETIRQ